MIASQKITVGGVVDGWASSDAACQAGGLGLIPRPGQTYVYCGKVALFCNPASGGTFSSTAIEIIKWVKKFAVVQAKVSHILRPGKPSEKTLKGVIPPSLCEISQNASRKKDNCLDIDIYSTPGRQA
jgi:hypothetical protein